MPVRRELLHEKVSQVGYYQEFVTRCVVNKMYICIYIFENRAVYEIMWKNMVEPDRPQMTI